jgi:hypothetical protein
MPEKEPPALLEELAASRPGWRMYDHRGVYAGRMFQYPKGQRALLSVSHVSRWHFAAQVNVPFAAGPEDGREGRFDYCREWLRRMERLLQVPLSVAECPRDSIHELVEPLKPRDLVLLCNVLEIRRTGSWDGARRCLVRHLRGIDYDPLPGGDYRKAESHV